MILGRPVNLWLAAITATINVLVLLGILVLDALQLSGVNIAAAALIGLIANQAPTVAEGSTVRVETAKGADNYSVKV